jgi:FtsP/CotA-like multicopper oxidase with cupredoxin domain
MTSVGRRDSHIWKFAVLAGVMTAAVVASTGSAGAQGAGEEIKRFDLRIENGRLADSRKTIQIKRGDTVEISWSADRPTVVHLHGYGIEITADAVRPQTMSFNARATGRFAIETHGSTDAGGGGRHAVLIYLEVHPR